MNFTLGFVFDSSLSHVLLIHKVRPAWQAGRINGVGGKLESGESPASGIEREVQEESGLHIPQPDWIHVADIRSRDWLVYVFTAIYSGDPADAQSITDEPVNWHPVGALPDGIISNLTWLIPLCLDRLRHGTPVMCTAYY
jgi:8-oxo-dGTP diphosphatase